MSSLTDPQKDKVLKALPKVEKKLGEDLMPSILALMVRNDLTIEDRNEFVGNIFTIAYGETFEGIVGSIDRINKLIKIYNKQ